MELQEFPTRARRLRAAGAGLAAFLTLGTPIDGSGRLSAGLSIPTLPQPPSRDPADERLNLVGAFSAFRSPEPGSEDESRAWELVAGACERYGIGGKALVMYRVLWEESRLDPGAVSPDGRYHGIGQFTLQTFRWALCLMKGRGLIPETAQWSPYDPANAIEVMAFMWSEDLEPHWGPYRRVIQRLQREEKLASRAVPASARVN